MNIKIVNDAEQATGLAVIIDVFRAFTVEPYLINNGAKKLIPVGDMQIAYNYKKKDNNFILIGERNGIILPGFDYGNSPSQIENIDFSGKTIIHTTSCGTQGIVKAINAKKIITGSLVNAKAIARYITKNKINEISLVALCRTGKLPADEDILCAKYIKSLVEDKPLNNMKEEIEKLKITTGSKFFDKLKQKDFPERDFYLCTEMNKFGFVLKVKKDEEENLYIEKLEI
mgnify:CR=1 FL=1